MTTDHPISKEERAKRAAAVAFGRANVRLEGFDVGPAAEAINDRYINGEIDAETQKELLWALVPNRTKQR